MYPPYLGATSHPSRLCSCCYALLHVRCFARRAGSRLINRLMKRYRQGARERHLLLYRGAVLPSYRNVYMRASPGVCGISKVGRKTSRAPLLFIYNFTQTAASRPLRGRVTFSLSCSLYNIILDFNRFSTSAPEQATFHSPSSLRQSSGSANLEFKFSYNRGGPVYNSNCSERNAPLAGAERTSAL